MGKHRAEIKADSPKIMGGYLRAVRPAPAAGLTMTTARGNSYPLSALTTSAEVVTQPRDLLTL